jgi:hypothetical protein
MLDTTTVTSTITRLISAGIPEGKLLAMVTRRFPELTWRELSRALQVAQAKAERNAAARH